MSHHLVKRFISKFNDNFITGDGRSFRAHSGGAPCIIEAFSSTLAQNPLYNLERHNKPPPPVSLYFIETFHSIT